MPQTSQLDVIMQQLDALSVEELLAVRAKVNVLIKGQLSSLNQVQQSFSPVSTIYCTSISQITPLSELEVNEDNSLEKLIELVDEWMADESGYDQEAYPQIEAALTQNHLSV